MKFQGIWMTEQMKQDIIDMTDDFYADTIRECLRIGLRKMRKRRRK